MHSHVFFKEVYDQTAVKLAHKQQFVDVDSWLCTVVFMQAECVVLLSQHAWRGKCVLIDQQAHTLEMCLQWCTGATVTAHVAWEMCLV